MRADISGFPEFLPNEQIAFDTVKNEIIKSFESFGFSPLDTVAVERVSTLLSKGNDNEIYGLFRLADSRDKKDLGLRFDLTVPLARYVSSYHNELTFPFKRYQIAPVWRGERPQYGRYRQFYQCDIDILGDGDLSLNYDAEVISAIIRTLEIIHVPAFHTYLNNRKILSGFMKTIVPEDKIIGLVRILDKSDHFTFEEFKTQIIEFGLTEDQFDKIQNFLNGDQRGDNFEVIHWLKSLQINEEFQAGVSELETVLNLLKQINISDETVKISLKLARGLSYYTGSIFETKLDNEPDIGSISGGGRYENLTSLLSKHKCPGVGATIGISRLVPKLMEKGILRTDRSSPAEILVTVQNPEYIGTYMRIAENFRTFGVRTELYLQNKPLKAQITYASKKGIRYVFIANDEELLKGDGIIRNLETREQQTIHTHFVGNNLKDLLK